MENSQPRIRRHIAALLAVLVMLAGCSSSGGGDMDAFDAGEANAVADGDSLPAEDDQPYEADDGGAFDAGEPDAAGDELSDGDGDGGDARPWPWCPPESAYHGGSWNWTVQASETAVYCVYCSPSADSTTLSHELQRKAELLVVPGAYPIPPTPGEYAYRLPLCLHFTEPDTQPLLGDVGILTVKQSIRNGEPYLHFIIEQPLRTQSGGEWVFRARFIKPASDGKTTIPLDGSFLDPAGNLAVALRICKMPCEFGDDSREFASCHFAGVPPERHLLVFEGGQVDLRLRISPGYMMTSQLPALFERAEGNLDGQSFRQNDYWKLAFTGGVQHYLNRHFLVLFNEPIGTSCGLKAENLDVFLSDPPARLTTVRCDLTEIEERSIDEESWEKLP